MRKEEELTNPFSCWNKGRDDESMFILLARDPAAPGAILDWVKRRVDMGLNQIGDTQIMEAIERARIMQEERTQKPGVRS